MVLHDVDAARIPEHTCHKLINSKKCKLQKCIQECSEQFNGMGECKQTFCFCTYYCKDPPMWLHIFFISSSLYQLFLLNVFWSFAIYTASRVSCLNRITMKEFLLEYYLWFLRTTRSQEIGNGIDALLSHSSVRMFCMRTSL